MEILKKYKVQIIVFTGLLLSGLLRIQHLWLPIGADRHAFRQTETAIIIQNYFNDGWSLFHYEMPVLGQPWHILFEFPIYQSVVYFVMRILHKTNIDVWCRLISLCSFYLSVFVLKKIAELLVDKKSLYCICAIYLFAPYTILWSRAALIDYMSVLFALVYVWGLYSWLTKGKRTAVIALVAGVMAYLLKVTTMFPYVFFLGCLIITYFVKQIKEKYGKITINAVFRYAADNRKRIILLALLCILPVIPGIGWTKYADMVKQQSVYTQMLTSEALHDWNYGTIEQKMQISNWTGIINRLTSYIGGKWIFLCMALAYICIGKKRNLHIVLNCILSVFLTIFLLFNLYYVHDYYIIALTPILSIMYGTVLSVIINKRKAISVGIIALCIVFFQIGTNERYVKLALFPDYEMSQTGAYIASVTRPEERIVIEGEDWNPSTLYYANRKGLMLVNPGLATEELFSDFLQQENYTTLVTYSPEFADIWAQHYNIFIQYPRKEEVLMYKFYQQAPILENDEKNGVDMIKIKYEAVAEPTKVVIRLTDRNGNEFLDSIILLTNKEEIYYYAGALWENIESVSLDIPENMKIEMEY